MKPLIREIARELCFVIFIICLFCQTSLAGEEKANAFLIQGLAHIKKGEHEKAIDLFKHALEINPDLEGAYLNLGIAYHKIGSYDLALKALQNLLEQNPDHGPALFFQGLSLQGLGRYQESIVYLEKAGNIDASLNQAALFNIGRAHFELGKNKEAQAKFNETISAGPNTETAQGAKTLLKILADKKPDKPWKLSAGIGIEYDDNITVDEQDLSSNLGDVVYKFDFSGGYKFVNTKKNIWEAGYSFFQSIHDDLTAFDLQSHTFSLNGSHKIKNLKLGARSNYSRTTLGNNDFLEIYSISPNVGFFLNPKLYTIVNYAYKYTHFFDIPSRDSQSHGLGLDNFYFFLEGKSYLLLSYRLERVNTRGDQFDFLGNFVTAKVKYPLQDLGLGTQMDLSYRFFIKDYNNITPSIGEERWDVRHAIQFEITQPVYKNLEAKLKYQYIRQESNLPTSDFKENIASLVFSLSF